MKITEVVVAEKRRRKKRSRSRGAAYGPGPYGVYGYLAGYSGEGGGEGMAEGYMSLGPNRIKTLMSGPNAGKIVKDPESLQDISADDFFQKYPELRQSWEQAYKQQIIQRTPAGQAAEKAAYDKTFNDYSWMTPEEKAEYERLHALDAGKDINTRSYKAEKYLKQLFQKKTDAKKAASMLKVHWAPLSNLPKYLKGQVSPKIELSAYLAASPQDLGKVRWGTGTVGIVLDGHITIAGRGDLGSDQYKMTAGQRGQQKYTSRPGQIDPGFSSIDLGSHHEVMVDNWKIREIVLPADIPQDIDNTIKQYGIPVRRLQATQGVAEEVTESRGSLFSWLKQQFPTWPDYVVKDFLYQQAKTITSQEQLADFLEIQKKDFGKVKWRLEKLPITLDIFTPKTQRMIASREGGSSNPFKVPKDAERHAQQLKMIQQHGVRTEPIIVAKLSNGYDLIEGWHRTIQHLKVFPEGYTGPAWVGYGATYNSEIAEQGVAEGIKLKFHTIELAESQIKAYAKEYFKCYNIEQPHGKFVSNIKRLGSSKLTESSEANEIAPFIQLINSVDTVETIKIGDYFSVLSFEINFAWKEIDASGFTTPKEVVDIKMHQNGTINYIKFADGDRYPRLTPATYQSKPIIQTAYFDRAGAASAALTSLVLKVPDGWDFNTTDVEQGVTEGKQPGQAVVDSILKVIPLAKQIWFHGSRATGRHRRTSDTDILVVLPNNIVGDQYLDAVRILQKLNLAFDNYDIQPTKSDTNIHRIAQEEGKLLWSKQGVAEGSDNLSYIGNCTDDDVIEHIFGDATGFAQAVEEHGNEFTIGDLVVKYDPKSDVHSFYYKKQGVSENFADGKNPGRKGLAKRVGVNCKQSVSKLRSIAAKSSGEKQRMAHWCANMKAGKRK